MYENDTVEAGQRHDNKLYKDMTLSQYDCIPCSIVFFFLLLLLNKKTTTVDGATPQFLQYDRFTYYGLREVLPNADSAKWDYLFGERKKNTYHDK